MSRVKFQRVAVRRAWWKFWFYGEHSEPLRRGSHGMYLEACTGPMPGPTWWQVMSSLEGWVLFLPHFPIGRFSSRYLPRRWLPCELPLGFWWLNIHDANFRLILHPYKLTRSSRRNAKAFYFKWRRNTTFKFDSRRHQKAFLVVSRFASISVISPMPSAHLNVV